MIADYKPGSAMQHVLYDQYFLKCKLFRGTNNLITWNNLIIIEEKIIPSDMKIDELLYILLYENRTYQFMQVL